MVDQNSTPRPRTRIPPRFRVMSAVAPIAALGRQVAELARNVRQYQQILANVDDPRKPACKDFRRWLKQDYRRAACLVGELKRARDRSATDLLTRSELTEQFNLAVWAESELRSVQGFAMGRR